MEVAIGETAVSSQSQVKERFLSDLAVKGKVASSIQNQAQPKFTLIPMS